MSYPHYPQVYPQGVLWKSKQFSRAFDRCLSFSTAFTIFSLWKTPFPFLIFVCCPLIADSFQGGVFYGARQSRNRCPNHSGTAQAGQTVLLRRCIPGCHGRCRRLPDSFFHPLQTVQAQCQEGILSNSARKIIWIIDKSIPMIYSIFV